jgi:hypothetical protein
MEDSTQKYMLFFGIGWSVLWIILIFLIIDFWPGVLYELPGIILLWIGLYNWGSGIDLKHKQDVPIENEGIELNADAK